MSHSAPQRRSARTAALSATLAAAAIALTARALGLTDRGRLAVGQRADFACWRVEQPAELGYWLGGPWLAMAYAGGRRLI